VADWSFCDFLHHFSKPEFETNSPYVVTPLSESGVPLQRELYLPPPIGCEELAGSLHEARLWMSGGNTTSSLHFDTHENLMLLLDGEKEVLLWHPNESHKMYMDHFNKYGLSPINVDRVDLQRYPAFAESTPMYARLAAGDALYIPDGWWHLIRSHKRNIAVTFEMHPWEARVGATRQEGMEAMLRRISTPGVFWAEQVRIGHALRRKQAASVPSPFRCAATVASRSIDEIDFHAPSS